MIQPERLRAIGNGLKKESFPELTDVVGGVDFGKYQKFYAGHSEVSKRRYKVGVDRSLKTASENVVRGAIAREFGYVVGELRSRLRVDYLNLYGFLRSRSEGGYEAMFQAFRYFKERNSGSGKNAFLIYSDQRKAREAEILVVKRELGSDLLAFLRYVNRRTKGHNKLRGLTVQQLIRLLREEVDKKELDRIVRYGFR